MRKTGGIFPYFAVTNLKEIPIVKKTPTCQQYFLPRSGRGGIVMKSPGPGPPRGVATARPPPSQVPCRRSHAQSPLSLNPVLLSVPAFVSSADPLPQSTWHRSADTAGGVRKAPMGTHPTRSFEGRSIQRFVVVQPST